jgi:hypothetical protein
MKEGRKEGWKMKEERKDEGRKDGWKIKEGWMEDKGRKDGR